VVSRRDAPRLARLAEATDGASFAADRWGDVDLDAALAAIRRDGGRAGARAGERVPRRVAASYLVPLAALAYGLLWLEGMPGGLRARALRRGTPLLLALGVVGAGPPGGAASPDSPAPDAERGAAALEARLRERPGDPRLLVALGVARAEAALGDEAERAFLAAALGAREPALAAVAYYDLGVLALERRDLAAARDAFFDALALDPSDAQARFNLEWTLRALRVAPPKPPPAGDSSERAASQPPAAGDERNRSPQRAPEASPEKAAPANSDPARGFAPKLDPGELATWLDAASDHSDLSMQSAAQGGRATPRPSDGLPQW